MTDVFDPSRIRLRWPNFLVIGAPRCGSTALCRYLSTHPQVFISKPKETFFFSYNRKYHSRKGWDWYQSLFPPVEEGYVAVGEGTTQYGSPFFIDKVIPRLKAHLQNCKFIYLVRHPLRRIESQWKLYHSMGLNGSFEYCVREHPSYVEDCRYLTTFRLYVSEFGRVNFHVIFFEDLLENPKEELVKVFQFLGVDCAFGKNKFDIVNPSRDLTVKSRFLRRLDRISAYEKAKAVIPNSMKQVLRSSIETRVPQDIFWNTHTLDFVRATIAEETATFLQVMEREYMFWDLNDVSV